MATIVNNPPTSNSDSGSGVGVIVGVVLAVIIVALFFMYALPAMRHTNSGGTNINVPDKINVDVNQQPSQ